jgi:hypothetical protein
MMKYVILYLQEQWPLILLAVRGRWLCDKMGNLFDVWFDARWRKELARREAKAASARQSP